MNTPTTSIYQRILPWKRWIEIGFWVVYVLLDATLNSITVIMDIHESGLHFADWEPVVWEWSSNLLWLALIWPMVWFTRRVPLQWNGWRRALAAYVAVSIAVSLLHVAGMYALRDLAYRVMGDHYGFGGWLAAWPYEYLKDLRSFFIIVIFIEAWRLLMHRLQGEARLLDAPDEGPPVEPIERPERFLVRKLGRDFLVATAEIEWIQAAGNYVNLHVRGYDYPLRSTMSAIEARLDPARFVRIHRSYLVNLGWLESIEPLDGGEARVHLRDAVQLPCSRRYVASLRAASAQG